MANYYTQCKCGCYASHVPCYDCLESQLQETQVEIEDWRKAQDMNIAAVEEADKRVKELETVMASSTNKLLARIDQLEAENAALRAMESPKQKEANKAAEHLLKHYKNWGCGHYNAGVCSECYYSLLQESEKLKTDNAELIDWLKTFELDFQQWDSGKLNADEIISDISRAIKDLLNAPHPGDSLLKELEALRVVRSLAVKLLDSVDTENEITWALLDALAAAKEE